MVRSIVIGYPNSFLLQQNTIPELTEIKVSKSNHFIFTNTLITKNGTALPAVPWRNAR